jgi:drug/metabolite transporter (DMT)-like permease
MLPVALGVVLYSTGPVLVQASSTTGPVFSFWRLWLGVGVLGAATLVQGTLTGRWPRREAWRWSIGAGAAFGVHQLMMFSAVKATSVADVTLITTLSPIVTALLALPFFLERPGWPFRAWSVLAMAGAAVVVAGGSSGPTGDPFGMALAVGNVLFFAVFFLLSKGSRQHLGVLPFLFGVMTAGALTVTAYVVVAGEPTMAVTSTDLVLAFIVAAGPGALGHLVMTWPLQWLPANVPPVMRLAMPLLAGLWAWWFLGEAITWWHVGGGALTLVGVAGAVLSPAGRAFVGSERGGDGRGPRGRAPQPDRDHA